MATLLYNKVSGERITLEELKDEHRRMAYEFIPGTQQKYQIRFYKLVDKMQFKLNQNTSRDI